MKKLLLIVGVALGALLVGIGGTLGVTQFMQPQAKVGSAAGASHPVAASAAKAKPKKLLFAALPDITVSLPPQPGADATSYVTLSLKFSTTDPQVLIAFAEVEPIIKSAIITRLMNETAASLQDGNTRNDLIRGSLSMANMIIRQQGNLPTDDQAFSAAYITNLVTQN